MLHSIDPNVDLERDKLAGQIEKIDSSKVLELVALKKPVALDEYHDYYTDGKVLVINAVVEAST